MAEPFSLTVMEVVRVYSWILIFTFMFRLPFVYIIGRVFLYDDRKIPALGVTLMGANSAALYYVTASIFYFLPFGGILAPMLVALTPLIVAAADYFYFQKAYGVDNMVAFTSAIGLLAVSNTVMLFFETFVYSVDYLMVHEGLEVLREAMTPS